MISREPENVTVEELYRLSPSGHGVRYFLRDEEDEMTYDTLAFVVRHDPAYGFADGQTIAQAGSHSDAELWSDVIVPAIVDGRIERAVWGVLTEIKDA